MKIQLTINDRPHSVDVDPDTPLLWVLRETLGMTGTKFGCGMALCGACSVHLDGELVRACARPVGSIGGKRITTIEGLDGSAIGRAVQQAWIDLDVVQCGWCQPGQCMAAANLIATHPQPTDADIDAGLSGNLCRCGTYPRIRAAVHRAAELARRGGGA
ncbi:MAG TPA: (2Fe-2S)-binding protein [Thermoanaerobaculia bacterium]|nr:(2Fe-2S)-binding protein [Thermoanaerobaculia bacterium]